jgi:hypothetical protein
LGKFILKKDLVTPPLVNAAIAYVETIPFAELKRSITKEFFVEMKKMVKEKKENDELRLWSKSLLVSICYRGSICNELCVRHFLYENMDDYGLESYFEEEWKKIMSGDEESLKRQDKEQESDIMYRTFTLKGCRDLNKSWVEKMNKYILEKFESRMKNEKEWKNAMMWILALRGLCEGQCFDFFFLVFFIFLCWPSVFFSFYRQSIFWKSN